METIGKLESFLYVSDLYKSELGILRNKGNKNPVVRNHIISGDAATTVSYHINTLSFNITNAMEYMKNIGVSDEIIEKFCESLIKEYNLDEKFTYDNGMSSYDFIMSIRNCLAHSNYFCKVEDEENNEICISNSHIDGKLDIFTLVKILNSINLFIFNIPMNTTEYTNTEKICNIQTNNKLNYTTALGSIKKKKYQIIFNNDAMSKQSDLIYLPLEQKEIESESYLTKEEVNCIKSYIEYYGLNKWLNLSSEKREYLINNVIKVMCEGDLCYPINADLGYLLFDEIISRVTSNRSSKYNVHGIKLDYYTPVVYASTLMQYSFYFFNYLKETSAKEGFTTLLFKDLDVNKFKFNNLPKEHYVKHIDNSDVETQYNNSVIKEQNLQNSIIRMDCSIETVKTSDRTEEEKQRILGELNLSKANLESQLEQRKQITEDLKNKKNISSYYNCTELFRRLRNSVSHIKYKIDYSEALRTRNFDNMVIRFFDNEDDDEYGFDVEIRAGDLFEIFEQMTKNMKMSANYFQEEKEIEIEIATDMSKNDLDSYIHSMSEYSKIKYRPSSEHVEGNVIKKTI